MASVSDFVKLQKTDSCKHLSSGMRYPNFVQWSGFIIPDLAAITSNHVGSEAYFALRKEINAYTQMRIGSSSDLYSLLCHAISESICENVVTLNGTVNVDFLTKCRDATEFLDIIKKACEKYAEKITVRPFLGIDTDNENNLPLAEMLLDSGIFAGIELYGTTFTESPEKFLSIFNTARRMDIESRLSCLGFRSLDSRKAVFDMLQLLRPTRLLNTNFAISKESFNIFKEGKIFPEIIEFTKDYHIHLEFSPAPTLTAEKTEEKARAIREIAESQLPFSFCTEDMLFFNKSISEFAADLCNAGVFSVEEMSQLISSKPSIT